MDLLKQHIDIGLFTNDLDRQLWFWKGNVGLAADHVLKIGGGVHQHRLHMNGSVLKINHSLQRLAGAPACGIRGLHIADARVDQVMHKADADGNRVVLVPKGHNGVTGIAVEISVRNRDEHDHFWRRVMQCRSPALGTYLCGDSLIFISEDDAGERCDSWRGLGWRYVTIQVADCEREHCGVLARGGQEGEAPRAMGQVATISFVRDPDGNFIELSQRASLLRA